MFSVDLSTDEVLTHIGKCRGRPSASGIYGSGIVRTPRDIVWLSSWGRGGTLLASQYPVPVSLNDTLAAHYTYLLLAPHSNLPFMPRASDQQNLRSRRDSWSAQLGHSRRSGILQSIQVSSSRRVLLTQLSQSRRRSHMFIGNS